MYKAHENASLKWFLVLLLGASRNESMAPINVAVYAAVLNGKYNSGIFYQANELFI